MSATKDSVLAAINTTAEIIDKILSSVKTALHESVDGAKEFLDDMKK